MTSRILQILLFFAYLLVLSSLVQSIAVLSPKEVDRIRFHKEKIDQDENFLVKKFPSDISVIRKSFIEESSDINNPQSEPMNVEPKEPQFQSESQEEPQAEIHFVIASDLSDHSQPRSFSKFLSEIRNRFLHSQPAIEQSQSQPLTLSDEMTNNDIPHPSNFLNRIVKRMSLVNRWMNNQMKRFGEQQENNEMIDEFSGMRMGKSNAEIFKNTDNLVEQNELILPRHHPKMMFSEVENGKPVRIQQMQIEGENFKSLNAEDDHRYDRYGGHRHGHGGHHGNGWRDRMYTCRNDMIRFCSSILPPQTSHIHFESFHQILPALMSCLSDHESSLSSECSSALSTSTSFQCAGDAVKLCPSQVNATPSPTSNFEERNFFWHTKKHDILTCLEQNTSQLSNKCLTAINNRKARHADCSKDTSSSDSISSPSSSSSQAGFPQWGLIAIVGISSALVFIAALTVLLLVQRKRSRQQREAINNSDSFNIPPLPMDVALPRAIRVTGDQPYHRMDEVVAI